MNEILPLAFAFVAGLALGAFFFGGLWWTVRRGVASKAPALLFLGSLLLRMGLLLVGFYLVANGNWQRMAMCLLGFVVARFAVSRLVKMLAVRESHSSLEVKYAAQL